MKRELLTRQDELVPYADALEDQLQWVEAMLRDPKHPARIWHLEHPHVLTRGRATEDAHVLLGAQALAEKGVEVVEVSRGGSVTYHGPGQWISYAHLNLKELEISLLAYLRSLEKWVIDVLGDFDIDGGRVKGKTGVWTSKGKICAMGVAARRYVSYHGLGLNYGVSMEGFGWIVPCGLQEPVDSMDQHLGRVPSRAELRLAFDRHLPEWANQFDLSAGKP